MYASKITVLPTNSVTEVFNVFKNFHCKSKNASGLCGSVQFALFKVQARYRVIIDHWIHFNLIYLIFE